MDAFNLSKKPILESEVSVKINSTLIDLKQRGYFTAQVISTKKLGSTRVYTLQLGKKTNHLVVQYNTKQMALLNKSNSTDKILVKEIDNYKKTLTNLLFKKGVPFTEISFTNMMISTA